MPNKSEILATLVRIANEGIFIAIAWHVAVALGIAFLVRGLRPRTHLINGRAKSTRLLDASCCSSRKVLGVALSAPLASVSAVSWLYGGSFNGAVFAASSALLLILALRSPVGEVKRERSALSYLGYGLMSFGWIYPHFLSDQPWVAYTYAAPLGTLPCPTLAFVIGVALVGRGMLGHLQRGLLVLLGAFYSAFGVARLGVQLDLILALGPVGLLVQGWFELPRRAAELIRNARLQSLG